MSKHNHRKIQTKVEKSEKRRGNNLCTSRRLDVHLFGHDILEMQVHYVRECERVAIILYACLYFPVLVELLYIMRM